MMHSSKITSLLDDTTRDAFECVVEVGVREWPASSLHVTADDGLVHLFYVLDGILACKLSTHLIRVLPREVLRIGSSDERVLENPSRSDTTTAIQLSLVPEDGTSLSTRHHYFSDDEKDNKLCRVAAFERDGRTLSTKAPVDICLTTLGRYDTLLLDRNIRQPMLVLCARGKATVNTVTVSAGDAAMSIETDTATIVGLRPCTILTIRGQNTPPRP